MCKLKCVNFFGRVFVVVCLLLCALNTVVAQKAIVSLSPSATEILCAVGAEKRIVARTDFCDYPTSVSSIPSLGGFDGKTFSLEKILSFRPDMVYMTAGMHEHLIAPLTKYGIKVFVSSADSIEAVLKEIRDIAALTGNTEQGERIASDIEKRLSLIDTLIACAKSDTTKQFQVKKVYWEIWNSPYMSIGSSSFISDIITHAGGENIFADVAQQYPVVSEESIIKRNPHVIAYPSDAPAPALEKRRGWNDIAAVRSGTILSLPADIFSRPATRIVDAVELLAQQLYPDLFE